MEILRTRKRRVEVDLDDEQGGEERGTLGGKRSFEVI